MATDLSFDWESYCSALKGSEDGDYHGEEPINHGFEKIFGPENFTSDLHTFTPLRNHPLIWASNKTYIHLIISHQSSQNSIMVTNNQLRLPMFNYRSTRVR